MWESVAFTPRQGARNDFTGSKICASASRFSALSDQNFGTRKSSVPPAGQQRNSDVSASQLQAARTVIEEYQDPKTPCSGTTRATGCNRSTLPLKMTISRPATRKRDYKASFPSPECDDSDPFADFFSQLPHKSGMKISDSKSGRGKSSQSQLGAFPSAFKAAQTNFYSKNSYYCIPQDSQQLPEEEILAKEEPDAEDFEISYEELIKKYKIDERKLSLDSSPEMESSPGFSTVEMSYMELLRKPEEKHGWQVFAATPKSINSFSHQFAVAKDTFFSPSPGLTHPVPASPLLSSGGEIPSLKLFGNSPPTDLHYPAYNTGEDDIESSASVLDFKNRLAAMSESEILESLSRLREDVSQI